MFTGIVEEVGTVVSFRSNKLEISGPSVLKKLETGGSVAVNGVCLTASGFGHGTFIVDVMPETLSRSNLNRLASGSKVNLELPVPLGGPMGGHLVEGHVDDTGKFIAVRQEGGASLIRFQAPPGVMRYVVEKGFIAVNGISLTVADRDASTFEVSVVNFTRSHTTLGTMHIGDQVNLEVDIIAKYVEQLSDSRSRGITAGFLAEHGFTLG